MENVIKKNGSNLSISSLNNSSIYQNTSEDLDFNEYQINIRHSSKSTEVTKSSIKSEISQELNFSNEDCQKIGISSNLIMDLLNKNTVSSKMKLLFAIFGSSLLVSMGSLDPGNISGDIEIAQT